MISVYTFPLQIICLGQIVFMPLKWRRAYNFTIDIMEILYGIADGQISSIFYLPLTGAYFHFRAITLVNINGFSPNSVCTLTL